MEQNDTQQGVEVIEPAAAPVAGQTAADIAAPVADPAVADDATAASVHPAHSVLNEIEDKLEMWCDDVEGEFSALLTKLRELL